MDRLARYRQIIKDVMTTYADFLKGYPPPEFEVALAFDDEHGQYISYGASVGRPSSVTSIQTFI